MDLINSIRNSINEKDFKMIYYNNYLDIINYENLDEITNDTIILNNKKIFIFGENIKILKLVDDELLISGSLTKVEYK